ncbi:MAG: hypothetical protein V1719_00640 [Patescibacteria group bacterium]
MNWRACLAVVVLLLTAPVQAQSQEQIVYSRLNLEVGQNIGAFAPYQIPSGVLHLRSEDQRWGLIARVQLNQGLFGPRDFRQIGLVLSQSQPRDFWFNMVRNEQNQTFIGTAMTRWEEIRHSLDFLIAEQYILGIRTGVQIEFRKGVIFGLERNTGGISRTFFNLRYRDEKPRYEVRIQFGGLHKFTDGKE